MVQLDEARNGGRSLRALGALPAGAGAIPLGRVRRVIEQDLDARIGELFAELDLGQAGLDRPRRPVEPRLPGGAPVVRSRGVALPPRDCGGVDGRRGFPADPQYVSNIFELGYPPRSPHLPLMRRLTMPPPTLLLRRMEVQVLSLLGDFHAAADWGAITAEHHSDKPASTALGCEEQAFREGHARG